MDIVSVLLACIKATELATPVTTWQVVWIAITLAVPSVIQCLAFIFKGLSASVTTDSSSTP